MSWRDRFKEGAWRGVGFLVQESQAQFGRRNQVHEYPQRDDPWTEDLGRAADRWSIECYVIGEDYDLDRDALIAALRAPGPGTLIHPYLGTVTAALAAPANVSESTAEGGMARFSLQFVEAGADQTPAAAPDTQGDATAAGADVQTAATVSVTDRLSVADQAAFVGAAAEDVLGQAQDQIASALAAVQPAADQLFAVQQQVQGLVTGGLALLRDPASLVSQVFAAIGGLADLAPYAEDALTQLCGPFVPGPATPSSPPQPLGGLMAFGAALPPVPGATPSRRAQAANQAVLAQLVQCAAAASAVGVVAAMDFTSYDDAAGIRDCLADQIDTVATAIADSGDAGLAASMDALRLALIADVTARGASLARLYAYVPATTEPAVVIAQRLYGDGARADDILARNLIAHPGFVPGGLALEVLSDA